MTTALKLGTRRTAQLEPFQFCEMGYVGDNPADPAYVVGVGSTTQSFEQMTRNDAYQNARMITVGDGHPAFFADRKGVGAGPGAGIVWGTSFGSVSVDISPTGGDPFDVVPLLNQFVGLAYPYVPK
ncbi:hypothetical protein ND991_22995 [Gordonia sputi]|uniref:hypothetical protein n=1 Tax=Gordonia sputi TaxID=36823 RepID=UPI002043FAAD|nr:hypothetical protein [Gordonia sputi]MCM3898067.1 hypothetical protein [Gordonia sputi]